jgi:fructosamine-3-kinase
MGIRNKLQQGIEQVLINHFREVNNLRFHPVGGGCINQCYCISFSGSEVFCKLNSANKFPQLFLKEKRGLERILSSGAIQAPTVIDCVEVADHQVLLQEWVYEGERTESFWKAFGEQLAALHRCSNEYFGWEEDNYMGSIPQSNTATSSWNDFFTNHRLQPLVKQSLDKGLLSSTEVKQFELIYQKLGEVFNPQEPPSFLHGDLWSGNFMCNRESNPVLIDPACYFGHRSIDLAMTTLFGGFRTPFYEAYNYHYPFPSNYQEQWAVCNLYPLLIHLLLFGRSYLPQIQTTLQQFA